MLSGQKAWHNRRHVANRKKPPHTRIHALASEATGRQSMGTHREVAACTSFRSLRRQSVDCAQPVDSKDQHETLSGYIWSTTSSANAHPRSGERGYGTAIPGACTERWLPAPASVASDASRWIAQSQWIAKSNTRRYQATLGLQHPPSTPIHALASEATGRPSLGMHREVAACTQCCTCSHATLDSAPDP